MLETQRVLLNNYGIINSREFDFATIGELDEEEHDTLKDWDKSDKHMIGVRRSDERK